MCLFSVFRTPTWRDRDGISLCNACGLRYAKLGVRCTNQTCGYVPMAINVGKACRKCQFRPLKDAQAN